MQERRQAPAAYGVGTGVYDNEMHPAYSMEASQEGFAMGHSENNIPAAQPNRPGYEFL